MKIKKLPSIVSLRKKAWGYLSEWVRRTEDGICVTCGKKDHWKNMNAGHFIHGNACDFLLDNIHCQCIYCNKYLHGNLIKYTLYIQNRYGKEKIDELINYKRTANPKLSRMELDVIINLFKSMVDELNKKEVNNV